MKIVLCLSLTLIFYIVPNYAQSDKIISNSGEITRYNDNILKTLVEQNKNLFVSDSLEDLFPELKEKKIKTSFELKAGLEVFRKIAAASIGLPLQFSERFTLVPELSIIAGLQASVSFRFRYRLFSPRLSLNIQPGFGYSYWRLLGAPCALIALSSQYMLGRKTSLILELKSVFAWSDPNTRGLSVEGADIIKSPPTSLSIGFSF